MGPGRDGNRAGCVEFDLTGRPTVEVRVGTSPSLRADQPGLPPGDDPPSGRPPLVIDVAGNTDDTVYVAARTLNGRPHPNTWISHADVAAGGTLAVTVADRPHERDVPAAELPYSASGVGRP